jgi:hypothetical protein
MTLKQGPNLGYRPKNGVIVGLSAQKGGHSWVISPKTGSISSNLFAVYVYMTLKQGPNLGYRPKNGVRVGLSAQKGGHSWVISPKTGSELGYRPKNGFFYFYVVAKWYIRQMAHSPNGSFAKWYIRQMVHSPISTQAAFTAEDEN